MVAAITRTFAFSGWSGLTLAEVAGFGVVALFAIWLTYIGIGSILGLVAILLGVFWKNLGLPLPAALA